MNAGAQTGQAGREAKPSGRVSNGWLGPHAESDGSGRHGPERGKSVSYDDGAATGTKQTPNPPPEPAERAGPAGWLKTLNSFLERAFLKADVDTGC